MPVAGLVRIKESAYFAIFHGIQFMLPNKYVEMVHTLVLKGWRQKENLIFCHLREKTLPIPENYNIVSLEPGCISYSN